MLRVGLSGGIGSGKSTVARRLAELGAVVVDADAVAREVVEPGSAGLAQVVQAFGPTVLTAEGALDRAALGQRVFADPTARRELEAITHPLIRARSAALMDAAPQDAVVVHDIPLLVELGIAADYALTVIVDVAAAERERRLVQLRGMPVADARARIAAQADDEARAAAADVLLANGASLEELLASVDRLWHERLLPFEAALRAGVPAGDCADPDTGAAAGRRLEARVRAALAHPGGGPGGDTGTSADSGPDLHAPELRSALLRRGLVIVAGDAAAPWVRSADPCLPLTVPVERHTSG